MSWCSRHLTLHTIGLFSEAQLRDRADDRQCVGMKGRFRSCEHRSYGTKEPKNEIEFPESRLWDLHNDIDEGVVAKTAFCEIACITVCKCIAITSETMLSWLPIDCGPFALTICGLIYGVLACSHSG